MPMQYPLYEFYSKSAFNLYEIRVHFLNNFYYQNHSRKEADNVLRAVVSSSKIGKLIKESVNTGIAPNYVDFLSTINCMFKFMFKSSDTQVLATIEAALRWDVEVNSQMHLRNSDELKQDIIRVFDKYQIYGEMTEEDFCGAVSSITVDAESVEKVSSTNKGSSLLESKSSTNSWSLVSFSKMFDEMQVGEFVNKETGDLFKSCVFIKGKAKTFVAFSSKLGALTPEEIEERKNELLVVKSKAGKYSLVKAKKGTWKKVNI